MATGYLIGSLEFDAEVILRLQGDLRGSAYTGQPLAAHGAVAGTWTRVTTTATVTTVNPHGYASGATLTVTVSSDTDAIVLGNVVITVTGDTTYTFACLDDGGASGTLTAGISVPGNVTPVYSTEGDDTLVDIADADSLLRAIYKLDTLKNSAQTYYDDADEIMTNPRTVRFDEVFKLTPLDTDDIFVSIDGEVAWGIVESETILPLLETITKFPNGQFAIGGRVTYTTISRGSSTFRVVSSVELCGRRGLLVPRYLQPTDLTLKRKLTFAYTGADQALTIASGETHIVVKCFGAGGGEEDPLTGGAGIAKGGAGGFTWGYFAVDVGDPFSVMVGRGGSYIAGTIYGFGGQANAPQRVQGGGLSGVFTGAGAIANTDDSRILAIAGGGGAGEYFSGSETSVLGGHGNAATGGEANFSGANAPGSGASAGGGGYRGGSLSGLGGSGYLASSQLGGAIVLQTGGSATGAPVPSPGAGDTDYVPGTGGGMQPGCVIVLCYGP